MNKNTVSFILFSLITILLWQFVFSPSPAKEQPAQSNQESQISVEKQTKPQDTVAPQSNKSVNNIIATDTKEEKIEAISDKYKITLTNKGAAITNWAISEKNEQWTDLVVQQDQAVIANLPSVNYKTTYKSNDKVVFEYISPEGWKITKTYLFSKESYMHNLSIKVEKLRANATLPKIDIAWGPGLSTDERNMSENISTTRVGAFSAAKPGKYQIIKNADEPASDFKWAAIDNRYFLIAFIPKNISDFTQVKSYRKDKKNYYSLTLEGAEITEDSKEINVDFYVGPKGYTYLQTYNLKLEETVDFGFFGFLGKAAFKILSFFHNATNNYGWAIIILTILIQILILPLTLKSFRSMSAMKRIQPMIKEIQEKYKDNKQRLNVEMMNIYKSQKVNPLGGCLPMLFQLPIFWAFFTMLRNAYELRGANWILWVNDLSIADSFLPIGSFTIHLLPLIMGLGMFLQQKITGVTSDPTQRRMMYILPIVFTFMFWSFPAGLVLYWLTNSVVSMIEQYIVLKRDAVKVKPILR
jgi:YidC/Oxa1 family membrane protein insertase